MKLTHIHHAVIHAAHSNHLHEVVAVVLPLRALQQVCVVLKQIVEELRVKEKNQSHSESNRFIGHL